MTELIIKVEGLEEADFSIFFYVERENVIAFKKEELIKVYRNGACEYYAPVDANRMGRGHLMAAVEIKESEPAYFNRVRKVTISGFTGYSIPCLGEGGTLECGGYKVTFNRVKDIPKSEGTKIFIGTIRDRVIGYEYITEKMITGLSSYLVAPMVKNVVVAEGDRLVIAIPVDCDLRAMKDDGLGGRMPFSTSIMGANGEVEVKIEGIKYRIFGEFVVVNGNLKIYIENE